MPLHMFGLFFCPPRKIRLINAPPEVIGTVLRVVKHIEYLKTNGTSNIQNPYKAGKDGSNPIQPVLISIYNQEWEAGGHLGQAAVCGVASGAALAGLGPGDEL